MRYAVPAAAFYAKAANLSEPPRYIDDHLSLAHIYEIQKNYPAAACAYQNIIHILITDCGAPADGDVAQMYRQKIADCKKTA